MNKLYVVTEYQTLTYITYTNSIDDVASLTGLSTSYLDRLQVGETQFVKHNNVAYIIEVVSSVADIAKLRAKGLFR